MALPELSLASLAYTADHYVEFDSAAERYKDMAPKFDLDAPYQRASVWTPEQRVALIKSLLMGLPIGSVIIAKLPFKTGRAHWRVVDGKQRIETIRAFWADEFAVPREWFRDYELTEAGSAFADVRFSELSQAGQRRLGNATVSALEFDSGTRWVFDPEHPTAQKRGSQWRTEPRNDEQMIAAEAELYGLVNGGGTPQTDADMANAATYAEGSVEP